MENLLLNKNKARREYRVAGIVIFAMSILVLLARMVAYYLSRSAIFDGMESYVSSFALDAIFSVLVQVGILFVMPFLVFKLLLKKSTKELLRFSNFRKTKPINLLLALALGVLGIVVTIGISFLWQILLFVLGYESSSSGSLLPENFVLWLFLGNIFITAILPGFCEEFTMRGGFLTAMRHAFPFASVLFISAISFGLFHQYIGQTFYTAFFGALMAYITIRTKSIYPAMIVHFTNNGLSVYLEFAEKYGWFGGGFYTAISDNMQNGNLFLLFVVYAAVTALFFVLLFVLTKMNSDSEIEPIMLDGSAPNAPRPNVPIQQDFGRYVVKKAPPLELDKRIQPRLVARPGYLPLLPVTFPPDKQHILYIKNKYFLIENGYLCALKPKQAFHPTLRDNIFYIGAIVVSALSTIFTMVWGFIM